MENTKIVKRINSKKYDQVDMVQLHHDFFVFVIRFVDILDDKCVWNGDFEVFFALGNDVKKYLKQQTLNCINYKLCIDKLPLLNVKEDFLEVFNELKNKVNYNE